MLGKWSATGMSILNNMNRHYDTMSRAMLRISSGYRINSAADDPAGLAISEKNACPNSWTEYVCEKYSGWDFTCANS